jgi:hypothetical protein
MHQAEQFRTLAITATDGNEAADVPPVPTFKGGTVAATESQATAQDFDPQFASLDAVVKYLGVIRSNLVRKHAVGDEFIEFLFMFLFLFLFMFMFVRVHFHVHFHVHVHVHVHICSCLFMFVHVHVHVHVHAHVHVHVHVLSCGFAYALTRSYQTAFFYFGQFKLSL